LWVDPNSGLGGGQIGITAIIQSTDEVTYAKYNISSQPPPFNQFISYIFALEHPLSTDTSSSALTQRESELQGLINGYRQTNLGGGLGFLNGGIVPPGGGVTNSILPGHFTATKCCRAHCKHYAYFHAGPLPGETPGSAPTPAANAEGDLLLMTNPGTPADTFGLPPPGNPNGKMGRLGKIGVTAGGTWAEYSYSGVQWSEAIDVFNQMLRDDSATLLGTNWTHFAVGHWRGGTRAFYWNIVFLMNPTPAN
jgi:hypothetical protein